MTWRQKLSSLAGKISAKVGPKNSDGGSNQEETKRPTSFMELVKGIMVTWARESEIQDPVLVREIFRLLYKCYNGIGEVRMFVCLFCSIFILLSRESDGYILDESAPA